MTSQLIFQMLDKTSVLFPFALALGKKPILTLASLAINWCAYCGH